jgi:hypothetical protein
MRPALVPFAFAFASSLLALIGCAGAPPPAARPRDVDLTSTAERSGWVRTGRHAEAVRLCDDYAAAFPGRARCDRFGTTAEGRAMVALVVGDPAADRPRLLIQGGIHAGEIEGKDAGFWFLRELLSGRVLPGALDRVTLVFVPILNPDGHERFTPNNRPNQRGPEEMGFRTNAKNLNLNRDYVKADTVELAALFGLWKRWDPAIYVDLHTTDGAKFEHDVAVMVTPRAPRPGPLGDAARALSAAMQARLTALGHLPLPFYPSFMTLDDPATGFDDGEPPPRFSSGYAAARGRLGMLVETHSWHTYRERVRATYDVLQALVERAVDDGPGWRAAGQGAERADAGVAGRPVVLTYKPSEKQRTIEFRGYRYQRRPSEVSGAPWTTYDERAPEVWRVPMRDDLVPDVTVTAPGAGYLVAAGYAAEVAARLRHHDIRFVRLDEEVGLDGQAFKVAAVTYAPPYEGRSRAKLEGAWQPDRRTLAPGALWIPIAQPHARLVLHLMEPTAPDSLAAWGFFAAALEQKEDLEAYVAEEIAREQLKDPAVKAAFDAALRDPAFAASPARRLEFFFRRHPSWDQRKDFLPIFRVDRAPRGR